MANIKYVSSSNVEFNLLSFEFAKLKTANFHKVKWTPEVEQKQFGVKINRFTKSAQTFDCTFYFKGDAAQRKKQIDDFIFQTEQDCSRLKMGRIYWDDQYIDVYFNSHDTHPIDSGMNWTEIQGQFYAPFPFWIDEQTLIIRPSESSVKGYSENVKGYPLDRSLVYGYEYAYPYASTAVVIDVDTPISSDFKVIAYGPTNQVQFFIAGHKYQVNYALRNGQYMVIDSRDTTPMNRRAYVMNENGTIVNVFDYRDSTSLLFEKIPNGSVVLNYDRTFGIDLTIFQERSAPR